MCRSQNISIFQHLLVSEDVWVSQFPGSKGRWSVWMLGVPGGRDARTGGTPPVTGQSHSGLGGASLCWAAHAVVSPFSGHSTEPERLQVVRDGFAWGGGVQGGVRGSLSERDEDTAILLLHGCCQPTKLKHNCWTNTGSCQRKYFHSPLG